MVQPITIRIKRLAGNDDLPLPQKMTEHAAGFDVVAAVKEPLALAPGEIRLIPCGFSMALPVGYEAQIRPRSGLALKHGLTCLNTPGTIDADYRGEVKVLLANLSQQPAVIRRGDRIAQLVVAPVARAELREAVQLSETTRGDGGFGSTGVGH